MIQLPAPHWPTAVDTIISKALDVHLAGFQGLYTCPAGHVAKIIGGSIYINADSPKCTFGIQRGATVISLQGDANVVAVPDNTQQALMGNFYLEAGDVFGINVITSSPGAIVDVVFAVEEYSI